MAKDSKTTIVGVKASSIAMFEGTLAGVIGLGVAIMYSLSRTLELAASTNSVLTGMAFGLATGIVSILILPLIYFAVGWLFGYLHGWIFNMVVATSGGIEIHTEEK